MVTFVMLEDVAMVDVGVEEVEGWLESLREWLCGCKSWLGCNELFGLEWVAPEMEEVSLSAKKPSRLEELKTSWAEVSTLLLVSWSFGVGERKRVVAGV